MRSFSGASLAQIAFPLGGIGTGVVSLGGRGNLQDWARRARYGCARSRATTATRCDPVRIRASTRRDDCGRVRSFHAFSRYVQWRS